MNELNESMELNEKSNPGTEELWQVFIEEHVTELVGSDRDNRTWVSFRHKLHSSESTAPSLEPSSTVLMDLT